MRERLLLVEDEAALARGLVDNFRDEGYEVRHVSDGDEAGGAIASFAPQVIVLDLMLPGRSGLDILRDLRKGGADTPVLVLTSKGDVVDRVVGLELGADDYLPKPFSLRELLARVAALLRRSAKPAGSSTAQVLELGGLRFDFLALTVQSEEGRVDLSTHDIRVLQVLAERRGEVVSREDIIEEVCGLDSEATLRTVDNHIVALRRALNEASRAPRYLRTVRGVGYRLTPEDELA